MNGSASSPFASFMMGGFECSTHRRRDGQRLDLIASTGHDRHAASDYRQLAAHGMTTVRDGVRWHLIEPSRGRYDWSSLDPMLAAARATGTQVIWDLLHYGWPDWTNPHDAEFVAQFADFAEAVAARIGPDGFYVPINEISFLSWGGGEVGYLNPFDCGRGEDLKQQLCKAVIAASRRIKRLDPGATLIAAEPLIAVHPADGSPEALAHAAALHSVQFDAIDCLLGRRHPEFGGSGAIVDIVGLNYYPYNQWYATHPPTTVDPASQRPLSDLLREAASHYERPVFIAETGCEGDRRAEWLQTVLKQVEDTRARGTDLLGICLYPILDHAGWDDDRRCPNGLLCGFSPPDRPVHAPLARVLAEDRAARTIVVGPTESAPQPRVMATV